MIIAGDILLVWALTIMLAVIIGWLVRGDKK
mgnify:CR=1 FL=1